MDSLRSKSPADLTEAETAEELTALADELAAHDIRYHQEDQPAISDADYDALKLRNSAIEALWPHLVRDNSPSLRVGAARSEKFSPVEHGVPMLSLDNAFSDEDAAGVRRPRPAVPEMRGHGDGGLYGRAQDRRPVGLPALRERRPRARRDARRRTGRRGRHREPAHHLGHSQAAVRRGLARR
jgi:hypothetical protein